MAADPLFTVAYTGVNAGMVIAVADDPGMHSSQNEQDSRHYAKASKIPMLEPSDSAEALSFTKLAYELSEEFDTPVIIKMCTRVAHSQSLVETSERVEPPMKPYEKNIGKYVMMPGNAIRRHPVVEERTRKLAAYAETSPLNRLEEGSDRAMGIITSSTSYQYVKEVFGDRYPVLKLGMVWPLPKQKILDFAASVDKVAVWRSWTPSWRTSAVRSAWTCWARTCSPWRGSSPRTWWPPSWAARYIRGKLWRTSSPPVPPSCAPACPHRGLFYTLNKNKCTVMGDIGCYSLDCVLNAIGYPKPLTVTLHLQLLRHQHRVSVRGGRQAL